MGLRGSFPTEPVTREAHPYLLPGEGVQEITRPSSSEGSAPPAVLWWFSWTPQFLYLLSGAAAGPFVRGCETERLSCVVCLSQ
ncbi:hypothetical protein Taro_018988 [Colocasia esculenta]|uniref:Uncharacterized protein n=1 Tax=Colocasia esculenta TaxID=4460 RepID=A0A843UVF3_COLES|nr:hypothetical protein [Colocasia esculenta]